jgi:hypothetical protein
MKSDWSQFMKSTKDAAPTPPVTSAVPDAPKATQAVPEASSHDAMLKLGAKFVGMAHIADAEPDPNALAHLGGIYRGRVPAPPAAKE